VRRWSSSCRLVAWAEFPSPRTKNASLRTARQRAINEHNIDVHYGVSVPSQGFVSVQQAYREAALSLSYTSPSRPIVSLDDLSSLECALIGATASTKAIIASKGWQPAGTPRRRSRVAVDTSAPSPTPTSASPKPPNKVHVHPNTARYRLQQIATNTGHDPSTFTGLVDLICILEITDNEHQPEAGRS